MAADSHLNRRLDEAARSSSVDPRDTPLSAEPGQPASRKHTPTVDERIVSRNEALWNQAMDFEDRATGERPHSPTYTRPNFAAHYAPTRYSDEQADREADRYERNMERGR